MLSLGIHEMQMANVTVPIVDVENGTYMNEI